MSTSNYKLSFILGAILATALLIVGFVWGNLSSIQQAFGSVSVTDEYLSTTTPQVADLAVLCGGTTRSSGSVGNVNFLSYGTGNLLLLDATTTDITLRTGNVATSSLIIAWFPGGTGTSSPQFDAVFKYGLLVDYSTGVATTTIAYRCGS